MAEGQGAPVAELVGPVSELVPTVTVGMRLHALEKPLPGPDRRVRLKSCEVVGQIAVPQPQFRPRHRGSIGT